MLKTRWLVLIAGLLVAVGFAFTLIGLVGEAVAILALLALAAGGLIAVGRRVAARPRRA